MSQMPRLQVLPLASTFFIANDAPMVCQVAGGWQAGDSDRVRRPRVSGLMCRAGCCGREARRQARARRNGLAEGVVQVAVDQAGLSHARLACAEERHEGGGG